MSGAASGGATIQIVTRGHLDFFLTVNSTSTLFRFVNVSHTNFAAEPVIQQFDTATQWNGTPANCSIVRTGDLVHRQYVVVTLPATAAWRRAERHAR
jgi:hypothetical protein